jgi:hypothetical protein
MARLIRPDGQAWHGGVEQLVTGEENHHQEYEPDEHLLAGARGDADGGHAKSVGRCRSNCFELAAKALVGGEGGAKDGVAGPLVNSLSARVTQAGPPA